MTLFTSIEEAQPAPVQKSRPRRTSRDQGSRHNADDDEMRFTGLYTKKDIPSKTFGRLAKMPSEERNLAAQQNGESQNGGE